ncbi:chemotaxis protein [Mesorhizobium sp. CAU 1732]|uniref:chemotaxis protein n=1 Tax=Mesorhizobium sp. CAU 1732 TaxID=3140358 RepID=UPI00325FFB6D
MNPQIDVTSSAPSSAHLGDRLEHARSRLEQRFLDGGTVLASALEQIGDLIGALDQVTGSLGEDAVNATIGDLTDTANQLLGLPALQTARQDSMRELAQSGAVLAGHVDTMLETLRYLRTFAVTVKITGAGAIEFAGFADEMLDKIQSGRNQVDGFSARLVQLSAQVKAAIAFGTELDKQYQGIVPQVTRDLSGDAVRMGDYHRDVADVARALARLVHAVQSKVAKVLSALQIGDITRQRIEHVQAGLTIVDEIRSDTAFPQADAQAILRLLADQTEDLLEEFHAGCQVVTSSLAGLAADTKEILALGKKARGDASGGSESFLRALETSVGAARRLVDKVEASGARADDVSRSAGSTAQELIDGVDSIRAIKTEIQHMAINTSLRCSRMGEAGKPMNVVASELRIFADQMETVSSHILGCLDHLSARAKGLSGDNSGLTPRMGETLDGALSHIRQSGEEMAGNLKELAIRGDQVAKSVAQSVAKLDFTRELGDVLEECAVALDTEAAGPVSAEDRVSGDGPLHGIAERIFATYTMARERDVHRRHFDQPAAGHARAVTAPDLDDVLF